MTRSTLGYAQTQLKQALNHDGLYAYQHNNEPYVQLLRDMADLTIDTAPSLHDFCLLVNQPHVDELDAQENTMRVLLHACDKFATTVAALLTVMSEHDTIKPLLDTMYSSSSQLEQLADRALELAALGLPDESDATFASSLWQQLYESLPSSLDDVNAWYEYLAVLPARRFASMDVDQIAQVLKRSRALA